MSNFHELPLYKIYKARIDWCVLKIGKRSFLGTDVLVARPNFRAMVFYWSHWSQGGTIAVMDAESLNLWKMRFEMF